MLSCVRVQVHFKMNVSLKLKNRIRISGYFANRGKNKKPIENTSRVIHPFLKGPFFFKTLYTTIYSVRELKGLFSP
jgi:hypothetical protein